MGFVHKFEGPRPMLELGTPARARATMAALQSAHGREVTNFAQFLSELDELWQTRAWEIVPEGEPYGSLDSMLVDVIGCDLSELERRYDVSLERYRREAKLDRAEPSLSPGQPGAQSAEEYDNTYSRGHANTYGHSDTVDRVLARLKREANPETAQGPCPSSRAAEMLDAIRSGAVSPNAAAREMGWRKGPDEAPRVQLSREPDRAAARLVARFGRDWCRDLVAALDAAVQREGEP